MPPSKAEVLAVVIEMSTRQPKAIFMRSHVAVTVKRELRTSVPYAEKILDELVSDGSVKKIRVAASGVLHLVDGDRLPGGLSLAYIHPLPYRGPEAGVVTLEHPDYGTLWPGKDIRSYYTTSPAWGSLRGDLATEAEKRTKEEQEKRAIEQALENVALEVEVPGYKEVSDALAALLPGVRFRATVLTGQKRSNPPVVVRLDELRMNDLKVVVDLLRRGLSRD